MLDVMSMRQFLILTSDLMTSDLLGSSLRPAAISGTTDRHLVTRDQPCDGPQNQMALFIRSIFDEHVLNFQMLKSVAIGGAALPSRRFTW
ncbi:hypothetical protein [Methylocystis sp. SC2]|uniref:hypothetical protein n=1 Tax=Methylocystis sp. (strain SC2) TaxID=187303 RepID=UPI00027AF4CC|nr:hypothetical protein [Methylocystis sp. SC2]CCJ07853.1 Putative ATPases involved in chromosome partitioning [Methylocystis sp. SC2]